MHRHLVPLPLRRPLAGLLVCALLLTQALGLLHRVLHADGPTHAVHERGRIEALEESGAAKGPDDDARARDSATRHTRQEPFLA